ncbi:MAG: T9SS type A sorting domain-containing protein [Flavobacteriales bacterium]|nr:T9SS type A sorting domain-containing protein [Flavobacteriales bacterium]MCB9192943.1 T9SS type A sorting domain-containing protein [Flavobacteriales bacterium]
MRTATSILPLLAGIVPMAIHLEAEAQNDIENVIVETYYVSNADDATDTIGGTLAEGSRTYRVFLDLCADCSLRAIYGDANHALVISSTAPFFNNLDRGKTFGHAINNSALDENSVAVDSWLSMGAASNQRSGILKAEDADGSIVGGVNNDGGSAGVQGGMLVNNDPDAGIPLTDADGLAPLNGGSALPPNFFTVGDINDVQFLDSVFLDTTKHASFTTHDLRIGCADPGTKGPTSDNKVLLAQLTTTGELTFALNVEVERGNGDVVKYVANDSILLVDETANGLLNYPPVCGCTDPTYLEYDPTAGCDDGSCQTEIVFGCLDTLACNYDPSANFNVDALCCYGPNDCNGLDIALICPGVGVDDLEADRFEVYPNPASHEVFIDQGAHRTGTMDLAIADLTGRIVLHAVADPSPSGVARVDISRLPSGLYTLQVSGTGLFGTARLVVH